MTMRSPARAIAWEFRRRHRWGGAALAVYFAVLAAMKLAVIEAGRAVVFHDAASFALIVIVPLTATFIYLLAVFSYGLEGDLAARHSMYPARMFTLPVTPGALAGWPMAYGCGAAVALWIATRLCAMWPSSMPVPIVWPGVLAASLLAWTQALTWMPYPARRLRVIVAVLWLCTIDTIVLLALHYRAPEPVMLALLAPQVPLAYIVARFALVRARRGDMADAGLAARRALAASQLRRFASPVRAQVWFEWRRHGRVLPALVAMLLPFELSLLFIFRDTPVLVLETLLIALVTPPLMAGFVAATVSRPGSRGGDPFGLPAFLATRPVSTGSLIASQFAAALLSTAAAWLLIALAIPMALTVSGTWPVVLDRLARTEYVFGAARASAIAVAGVIGLAAWTWKRLTQSLYIGLAGREWLVKANVFGTLALLVAGGMALWLVPMRAMLAWMWDAIPGILSTLAILKIIAATWIANRVFKERLLSDRALVVVAACWCGAVFAVYAAFVWFVDTPFVPHYLLLLAAILAVPLARISAGPFSLARNRHR